MVLYFDNNRFRALTVLVVPKGGKKLRSTGSLYHTSHIHCSTNVSWGPVLHVALIFFPPDLAHPLKMTSR